MDEQKTAIRKMEETAVRREAEDMNKALSSVNDEIAKYEKKLRDIISSDKDDPITIEGETTTGYFCHIMVEAKDVAKIILSYNYPVWRILGSDAPDAMWDELARKFGLGRVMAFDL